MCRVDVAVRFAVVHQVGDVVHQAAGAFGVAGDVGDVVEAAGEHEAAIAAIDDEEAEVGRVGVVAEREQQGEQ